MRILGYINILIFIINRNKFAFLYQIVKTIDYGFFVIICFTLNIFNTNFLQDYTLASTKFLSNWLAGSLEVHRFLIINNEFTYYNIPYMI
jgi:hypothetical protein